MILLMLLFSLSSYACINTISIDGAQVAIDNAQKNLNNPLPKDWNKGSLCYDSIEWGAAEIVDNVVDDLTKPIKRKFNQVSCQKECPSDDVIDEVVSALTCTECLDALKDLNCTEKYIDELFSEAYCVELVGYEQKIEGKKLINSELKLADLAEKRRIKKEIEDEKERKEGKKRKLLEVMINELLLKEDGTESTEAEIKTLFNKLKKTK